MKSTLLHLASKSNAIVKLSVEGDGDGVVDIPVKNLIKISSGDESFTGSASYSNLHHCGMSVMFKYMAKRNVPTSTLKKRELVTYYKNEGRAVSFSTDYELTIILEEAISDNLMDDNDGVILHIFCKYHYHPTFSFSEVKKVRSAATTAADNVIRKMKIWFSNVHQSIEKKRYPVSKNRKDYGLEYDVIVDVDVDKEESKPAGWAKRLARFLLLSEEDIISEIQHLKTSNSIHSSEKIFETLLHGVVTTSELFSSGAMTAAEFISSIIDQDKNYHKETNTDRAVYPPTHNLDDNSIGDPTSTLEDEDHKGVEIIFSTDSENMITSSEWQICFDPHLSEPKSVCSSEDKILLDKSPSLSSCSSQSNISYLVLNDATSVPNSDVVSLASDDSQTCLSKIHNTQSCAQISAFSVVDSDDGSWDILEKDE